MSTELGAQASRINGAKSHGPTTREGKRRSALNAMTHGIFSRQVVLDCEDRFAYEQFAAGIFEHYRPVGGMELMLADRIAAEGWRLARIARIEREIMDSRLVQLQEIWDKEDGLVRDDDSLGGLPAGGDAEGNAPAVSKRQVQLGQAARRDFFDPTMGNLRLYETRIERSLYRATAELRRIQAEASGAGSGASGAGVSPASERARTGSVFDSAAETAAALAARTGAPHDAIAARRRQAEMDLQRARMEDRRQDTLRQIEEIEHRLREESLRQAEILSGVKLHQRLWESAGKPCLDETPEVAQMRQAQLAQIKADLAAVTADLDASKAAFAALGRELVELEQRLAEEEGESGRRGDAETTKAS